MKRISILTFWGVPNRGAFAQAYALNKIIKDIVPDYDVKHIAYLHQLHRKIYFEKEKPSLSDLFNLHKLKSNLSYYVKGSTKKFTYFDKDWDRIPHISINNEEDLENYSCGVLITGSDAIWQYSSKQFGEDYHLMGLQMKFEKKISYAASFGDMSIGDEFPSFVKKGIKSYNSISVRDGNSAKIVRDFSGIKPVIVLDPTLLYNFRYDRNIESNDMNKYALVYGFEFPDFFPRELRKWSVGQHISFIGAGMSPAWCDVKLPKISPLSWIGLFHKAEIVITSTFHGLMLGLNYGKRVIFYQTEYVKHRSQWLLDELGIIKVATADELNEALYANWDYNSINNKMNFLRKQSMNYIQESLLS